MSNRLCPASHCWLPAHLPLCPRLPCGILWIFLLNTVLGTIWVSHVCWTKQKFLGNGLCLTFFPGLANKIRRQSFRNSLSTLVNKFHPICSSANITWIWSLLKQWEIHDFQIPRINWILKNLYEIVFSLLYYSEYAKGIGKRKMLSIKDMF